MKSIRVVRLCFVAAAVLLIAALTAGCGGSPTGPGSTTSSLGRLGGVMGGDS